MNLDFFLLPKFASVLFTLACGTEVKFSKKIRINKNTMDENETSVPEEETEEEDSEEETSDSESDESIA